MRTEYMATDYIITDQNEHNITIENFESFLETHFPEYTHNGLLELPLYHTYQRKYNIMGIGKIRLIYGQNNTEIDFLDRDTEKSLNELKEKTEGTFHLKEKEKNRKNLVLSHDARLKLYR